MPALPERDSYTLGQNEHLGRALLFGERPMLECRATQEAVARPTRLDFGSSCLNDGALGLAEESS